jgi:prefoldin subunit 5
MNIKTASIPQLKERQDELSKEYEKNKAKLIALYQKMDKLSEEYNEINEIIKTKT